ncbi:MULTISPECIES: phage holin family protein [Pseudofrankia]|uniref:phage holin family protein n=1 Tax=Pseudofrankia TaxID=2994363 RepID=UPI000234B700|nr:MULTISPECIES: phage holin family protein [Pseudofrankia]
MTLGNGDRRAGKEASLGELVAIATRDMSLLVRQEIDLAKAELARQAASAAVGAGLIGAAAGLGLGALIALTIFLGELFTWAGLERFWSFLITAVLLLALAGMLALVGAMRLRKLRPPQRAISSVREDVAVLRHSIGSGAAGRGAGTAPAGTAQAGTDRR